MALTVACAHGAGLGALGRVQERLSSSVDVLEQKEPNSLYSTPATHSSTGTPTSTSKTVTRLLRSAVFWLLRAVCALLFSCPMTAWVHKECDIMDEDALLRLQGAWENPQQKDECSVRMDDL